MLDNEITKTKQKICKNHLFN